MDVHTQILAGGFRDKIFDAAMIFALERVVNYRYSDVSSTIQFFTAAIGQGALRCFHRTFILKYSQRAFGTREFIL